MYVHSSSVQTPVIVENGMITKQRRSGSAGAEAGFFRFDDERGVERRGCNLAWGFLSIKTLSQGT
jgi:hypothetical protein